MVRQAKCDKGNPYHFGKTFSQAPGFRLAVSTRMRRFTYGALVEGGRCRDCDGVGVVMVEAEGQRGREPSPASDESAQAAWPDLSGVHVFLVEDNEDTREMVSQTLEFCGAMVTAYDSADSAIADLGEFMPTVFICDLSMPRLDGLGFLRAIRRLPPERGGDVP